MSVDKVKTTKIKKKGEKNPKHTALQLNPHREQEVQVKDSDLISLKVYLI